MPTLNALPPTIIAGEIADFAMQAGWDPEHPVVQTAVARAVAAYEDGATVGAACDVARRQLRGEAELTSALARGPRARQPHRPYRRT